MTAHEPDSGGNQSHEKAPSLAVVIEGGVPSAVVIDDDWPIDLPLPHVVSVDLVDHRFDPSGVRHHLSVDYGGSPEQALCLELPVVISGSGRGAASDIEPSALVTQMRVAQKAATMTRILEELVSELTKLQGDERVSMEAVIAAIGDQLEKSSQG